jgi:hypothetical protein
MEPYPYTYIPESEVIATIDDMDAAIEALPATSRRERAAVLYAQTDDISPEALHAFGELAEALHSNVSMDYGSLVIWRPKTREELETAAISAKRTEMHAERREEWEASHAEQSDN